MLIPARGEVALLPTALESVRAQDYDGVMEVVVADGAGTPAMAEMIRARFPEVRVVPNPERNAAAGLNRALAATSHPVIARCDVRCVLPAGYIRRAVVTLERTSAVGVGGRQRPVGTTAFEQAVGLAMSMPLGSGDARWRRGGPEGPAETVFLGVFRRESLEAVGGFDATLGRNQDYELNWRLRRQGGMVWFDPALEVGYRPRGTFAALARQYFEYGRWKRVVLRRHPGSWRWRQLAAPLLVLLLAGSGAVAVAAAFAPPAGQGALLGAVALAPFGYLSLLAAGAACSGLFRKDPAAVLMPGILATMHLSWGTGFLFAPTPQADR